MNNDEWAEIRIYRFLIANVHIKSSSKGTRVDDITGNSGTRMVKILMEAKYKKNLSVKCHH